MGPATDTTGFGINLYGHVSGNFGLAVAARNTLRAIEHNRVPYCVVDIDAGGGRSGHVGDYAKRECREMPPPFPVNLIHTNPWDIVNFLMDSPDSLEWSTRLNVCVPFWELPNLPPGEWRVILGNLDAVLAPSKHIADAVRSSCPEAHVIPYPQAVFLPDDIKADRCRWGIHPGAFAVFMVMDVASDVERKNPMAAYSAFCEAFASEHTDVQLVVKLNNPRISSQFARDTERVLSGMRHDPRVLIIEDTLDYRGVLSLSASCDALISLHRAEGLGLNLMEAMSLGKPVIATGWSGNLDFMNASNSLLIGFRPVRAESNHPSYSARRIGQGQTWAEPSVSEAAAALVRLHGEPELRGRLGQQASLDMQDARRRYLEGIPIIGLQDLMESERFRGAGRSRRVLALEAAARGSSYRRTRRRIGKALRRLGLRR